MEYALQKYGTMKRQAVLAPVTRYAQDGFVLDQGDIDILASATDDFRRDSVSVAIFLNKGEPFQVGQKIVRKGSGAEMDDFTAKVGVPNLYGLVQGEANRIEPGKRPLRSMSPTIVTKDGKPVMVVGKPVGSNRFFHGANDPRRNSGLVLGF